MEILEKVTHNNYWVNKTVRDLEEVAKTFSFLNDESIEKLSGEKVTILENSVDIVKSRASIPRHSNDTETEVQPLKLNYIQEHKAMEDDLESRLDVLKEAINILNDTETNAEKLRYLTSNIDPNPHLVDIGYENVVLNFLREELIKFNKANKLNYFIVTPFVREYNSYKNIGISVKLKGYDNQIFMFTEIAIADKDVQYPKHMNISISEHEAKLQIAKINAEYNNLTSEIKAYNIVIKDLEDNILSKYVNKNSIKRYKLFINDSNIEISRNYAAVLELQAKIEKMQDSLYNFNNDVPNIEKEQDMIFQYISELFDTKVIKQSLLIK